jgi:hypothetical protein
VTTIPSDGEAAVLLGRYGTASFVAPSGEGIAEGVRDLIRAGNAAGVSDETYRSFLSDFARSVQARKLLEMLTDLTGTQPSGGAGLRRVD